MNKLFVALAVAAIIASPAIAQSTAPSVGSDPSVGSGNIAGQIVEDSALGAYAYESLQKRDDKRGRTVLPFTLQERRAFEAANTNIW